MRQLNPTPSIGTVYTKHGVDHGHREGLMHLEAETIEETEGEFALRVGPEIKEFLEEVPQQPLSQEVL